MPHSGLPAPISVGDERWMLLARRAKRLSWLSLLWIGAEGVIGISAGIIANSVALIGFGIDSVIEGFASLVIVWRFTGSRLLSDRSESRAQKLVAFQFFVLAPYIGYESLNALITSDRPETSYLGMTLAATSMIGMPLLGIAKRRIGEQIGSAATRGEGNQNLLCAYLATALLLGLLGNTLFGAWWLDPIVGLFIAAVAIREGINTWHGKGCCAPVTIPEVEPIPDVCCSSK